jgi:hypothetical protein
MERSQWFDPDRAGDNTTVCWAGRSCGQAVGREVWTLTGRAVEDGAVDAREAAREVVERDECEEHACVGDPKRRITYSGHCEEFWTPGPSSVIYISPF